MKKLYLSSNNKFIKGVCGGIGEYFNVDPTVIRVGVVFLTCLTAFIPLTVAYIVMTLIIPREIY